MNILRARNVHRAFPLALEIMNSVGRKRNNRNAGKLGQAFVADGPVATVYDRPTERVLFWRKRDANPFFHFYESLWMLGGRNDVASMARFAKRFAEYSDDGSTFHGAYGYRWRVGMPADKSDEVQDQLKIIANRLRANPDDRRCVLQMWDARSDLGGVGNDVPCNTMATFQMDEEGHLNLVVFNRSNDIVWGCYGANAVQFSTLLEYMAFRIGCKVGTYTQISVNWHAYEATYSPLYGSMLDEAMEHGDKDLGKYIEELCPYELREVQPYPLAHPSTDPEAWDRSLTRLLRGNGRAPVAAQWEDPFFEDVALPILRTHDAYKDTPLGEERFKRSLEQLAGCKATDWYKACSEWINRRWKSYQRVADDGVNNG